jgi:hypothetical protein
VAKEVPYFSNNLRYAEGWEQYLRKAFAFSDPGHRWGTVTPHYMYGAVPYAGYHPDGSPVRSDVQTVPRRIHEQLPDVRLIAILRDPVERARSHHGMTLLNGWESRDFDLAIRQELEPQALDAARHAPEETNGYVAWGEYGRILGGYLDVFSHDQLLILFTSELRKDPRSVLRRVFEFLSVDPDFVPDNLGTNYRPGAGARRLRWLDLNRFQRGVAGSGLARRTWHALPERARRRVDTRFDRMNYRVRLWNRRDSSPATPREDTTDLVLRRHYAGDAEQLASMFGVRPPWAAQ